MIRISDLHKNFGSLEVLRGIDLEVSRREVMAIIGPSGSGKSTLLRCINYLEIPTSGEIVVDGVRVNREDLSRKAFQKHLNEVRTRLGMVFQQFNLFPHKTALENVTEGPVQVLKLDKKDAEARGREILERVGLADKADTYPAHLSGGQQQRVAIARALAMEPAAILFDEATSALDPELVGEVLKVMEDLARGGMTMLVVTHEMGFAERVADQVVFMSEGRIVESAPPAELFSNPREERTRQFLADVLDRR